MSRKIYGFALDPSDKVHCWQTFDLVYAWNLNYSHEEEMRKIMDWKSIKLCNNLCPIYFVLSYHGRWIILNKYFLRPPGIGLSHKNALLQRLAEYLPGNKF